MYRSFTTLEELIEYMRQDKACAGAESSLRNRYPIRFVLFDDFADFSAFIDAKPEGVYSFSITRMLELEHPDLFPTFTDLSRQVREYIGHLPSNDYILYPFSELTRFYPAEEFGALVRTIKGIEPPADAQAEHVRIYIPIVGMAGKMGELMQDPQAFVWGYRPGREATTYRLVIADPQLAPTVAQLSASGSGRYTVAQTLQQWLELWKQGAQVQPTIFCTSPRIALNARHAQPDNAFEYVVCRNAYELLTLGLGLDLAHIAYHPDEEEMWREFATRLDPTKARNATAVEFWQQFPQLSTLNSQLSTTDFLRAWFDCESDFDRWLLALYFRSVSEGNDYLAQALQACPALNTTELFSALATHILDTSITDEAIAERARALREGKRRGVAITDIAERRLCAKLSAMLASDAQARFTATRLLTDFTPGERALAIRAFAKGTLRIGDLRRIYPALYSYLQPMTLQLAPEHEWVRGYLDAYRRAKVCDTPEPVAPLLKARNASPADFRLWLDTFPTVKTLLSNRPDIDALYWIDGLGADWIPFIADIVRRHSHDAVYLNEIFLARAELPTTTAVNRLHLQALLPEGRELPKAGDLDAFAHKNKTYPEYLPEEMELVERTVADVLTHFAGRKVAFVSDHGLTYLAQHGKGLGLGALATDHEGRTATAIAKPVADDRYFLLDDGTTLCSLTHDSLGTKTPKGHGAHGGATPEEVLVPVVIVSDSPNASTYSASLLSEAVDAIDPVVRVRINGLSTVDVPSLEYNSATYALQPDGSGAYVSERLPLVGTASTVTLFINGEKLRTFPLHVSTGAQEDDLFNF